jgi:hypothetical protein
MMTINDFMTFDCRLEGIACRREAGKTLAEWRERDIAVI